MDQKALTLLMEIFYPHFFPPLPLGSGSGNCERKDLTTKQSLEFSLIRTGLAIK